MSARRRASRHRQARERPAGIARAFWRSSPCSLRAQSRSRARTPARSRTTCIAGLADQLVPRSRGVDQANYSALLDAGAIHPGIWYEDSIRPASLTGPPLQELRAIRK